MRLFWLIFALLMSCNGNCAEYSIKTQPDPIVKFESNTRETDYTIGDVATQHLVVEVPNGYELDEGSIPEKGQTDAVELRDVQWKIEEGDTVTRYTFAIDWQIFVAFETVKSTPLRGLELVFKNGAKSINVSVPPDSVLISNLLPPKMDEQHVRPYADVPPQKINMLPLWLGVIVALFVLLISGLYMAWFLGWITLPSEKNMPFRQAWHQIKRLPENQQNSMHIALKIIGQAVSNFAGHTVTHENLSKLCASNTRLKTYSPELIRCFQDIQSTFFAGEKPTMRIGELKKLAKQLSRLELS